MPGPGGRTRHDRRRGDRRAGPGDADPRRYLQTAGARTLYIEPDAPWENGYAESFHGRLRDELLNAEDFADLREAKVLGAAPIRWRKFAAEDQGEFLDRYREVFWQSIGAPNPRDTLATSHFRARLNGLFGAPTRNAAAMEQEEYAGSEFVQFEYWLIANDSIPILVLDIDGPFGRGLLVAADEAYTDIFAALKNDLYEYIFKSEPTPYADYYNSRERRQWYRTGFDGTEYFIREVRRPRWAGRSSRDEKWRIFR